MNPESLLSSLDSAGFITMRMLLSVLWQSTALFAACGALAFFLRRRNETVRHAVWVITLILLPLLPLFSWMASTFDIPRREIPVLPVYSVSAPHEYPGTPPSEPFRAVSSVQQTESEPTIPPLKPDPVPPTPVTFRPEHRDVPVHPADYPWALAFLTYLAGASFLLLAVFIGHLRVRRWISRGEAIFDDRVLDLFARIREHLGLRREVALIESAAISVPLACGIFRPLVLLPRGFAERLSDSELGSVAAHELSHIQRRDPLTFSFISIVRAIFFFQPLVWLASRESAYLSECACDGAVVELTGEARSYAGLLSRLSEALPRRAASAGYAAGFLFSKGVFLRRVESILAGRAGFRRLSRPALTFMVLFGAATLAAVLAFPLGYAREAENRGEIIVAAANPAEPISLRTAIPGDSLQTGIRIAGTVTFQDKPVSGAEVYFGATAKPAARTGNDGRFSLTLEKAEQLAGWMGIPIAAVHPGYAIGLTGLSEASDWENLAIPLNPLTPFSGVVQDSKGAPNAKATVQAELYSPGGGSLQPGIFPGLEAKTDRNGRYTFERIPSNIAVKLAAYAPGYAETTITMAGSGSRNLLLTLTEPEGRIEGRVTFGDRDEPVKGVVIRAKSTASLKRYSEHHATTDSRGRFSLTNLSREVWNLFADAPEGWVMPVRQGVRVESGKTIRNVNVILLRGGYVTGRVIDADTGRPIPHHRVMLADSARSASLVKGYFATYTDSAGVYRFLVAPGKAEISADRPWGYEYTAMEKKETMVASGKTVSGLDFRFRKGEGMWWKAIAPGGSGIPNVQVNLIRAPNDSFPSSDRRHIYERTGKDGSFLVSGFRPGDRVAAEATGVTLRADSVFTYQPGKSGFALRLQSYETTSVTGLVLDQDRKPLPGAMIMVMRQPKYERNIFMSANMAVTDAEGRYTTEGLIIGDDPWYRSISAEKEGFTTANAKLPPLRKNMDPLPDMVLMPKAKGNLLEGTILDAGGRPIPGAGVSAQNTFTKTDSQGRFVLDDIPSGMALMVSVRHDANGSYTFNYLETGRPHVLTLRKPEGFISGKVVDASGAPVEGIDVYLGGHQIGPSGFVHMRVKSDKNGAFRIENVEYENNDVSAFEKERGYATVRRIPKNTGDVKIVLDKKWPPDIPPDQQKALDYIKNKREIRKESTGKPAPEFEVSRWVSGKPVSPADIRGKIAVILFLATEPPPSYRPLTLLDYWQRVYGEKGVICFGIHPYTDDAEKVRQAVAERTKTLPVAIDRRTDVPVAQGVTYDRYGAMENEFMYIPEVIVIDREGKIALRQASLIGGNHIDAQAVEKKLNELLGIKP
ncbi:MAG: M56 family metallopeptidase [Candidatus Latescibacterota bacterium]